MNKLQEIKEEFEDIRARFDGTRLIEFCLNNFDLLIQEVERLQTESQLDKFLIGEQEHVTHMQEKEVEKLKEENQRLKEEVNRMVRDNIKLDEALGKKTYEEIGQRYKIALESLKEQIDQGYSYDELHYAIEKALESEDK
jgi:galactokinase/mevalonate kinase-like predicted kinase